MTLEQDLSGQPRERLELQRDASAERLRAARGFADACEDLLPLPLARSGTERVALEVPGQADAGRQDHVRVRSAGVEPTQPEVGERDQVLHVTTQPPARGS